MRRDCLTRKVTKSISAAIVSVMLVTQAGASVYAADVSDGDGLIEKITRDWKATSLVKNGDFETGDTTGWDIAFPGADGNTAGSLVKTDMYATSNLSHFFNIWNNKETPEEFSMKQTVTDIPAGVYKVTFDADGNNDVEPGIVLKVNGKETNYVSFGWNLWQTYETEEFEISEGEDITISFEGGVNASYWGDIDNICIYSDGEIVGNDDDDPEETDEDQEDTAVDADIFVNKVNGCDESFITGVDVSSYIALKNGGIKYFDYDGNELDDQGYFNFLHECGVNYVRIRVWNDPHDENGNAYGGGNCDLEQAKRIGQWVTNAGMKVLIDFHYSDFWADPGKQTAPKAWAGMNIDEKEAALKEFTVSSLNELIGAGVDVGMVQVGNETNNGIAGENNWNNMTRLFAAGAQGVREVSENLGKDILVALHFTNPESGRYAGYAETLANANVDYDVFASSYYPYWHGTLDNLKSELTNIANTYNKKVMVAETSYVYTLEDGDGCENTETPGEYENEVDTFNFDVSVQGQVDSVRAVVATVASIDNGIGVFYWEPAWLPVNMHNSVSEDERTARNKENWETYGTGWATDAARDYDEGVKNYGGGGAVVENEAWFDFYGHPLASAKMYSYMRTGAVTDLRVVSTGNVKVTANLDEEIVLPETISVRYNDGSSKEFSVSWNKDGIEAAKAAGSGEYNISGKIVVDDEEKDVYCKLIIKGKNYLTNPGFEDGAEGWSLTTNAEGNEVAIKTDSSNVHSGDWCMKFWYGSDFEFVLEQEVTLNKGVYSLDAFVQGGDAGENDEFRLFVNQNGEEKTQTTTLNGWKDYTNPKIDNIVIKEDGTIIKIGASTKASGGCWGSWDDFSLVKIGDVEGGAEDDEKPSNDTTDEDNSGESMNPLAPEQNQNSNGSTAIEDNKTPTVDTPATETEVKVTKVKLNKKKKTLKVGKKYQLKATVKPLDATNKNVTWKSSNKKVAKVSKKGKVTALSKGTATITVVTKDGKLKAKCKITVK